MTTKVPFSLNILGLREEWGESLFCVGQDIGLFKFIVSFKQWL